MLLMADEERPPIAKLGRFRRQKGASSLKNCTLAPCRQLHNSHETQHSPTNEPNDPNTAADCWLLGICFFTQLQVMIQISFRLKHISHSVERLEMKKRRPAEAVQISSATRSSRCTLTIQTGISNHQHAAHPPRRKPTFAPLPACSRASSRLAASHLIQGSATNEQIRTPISLLVHNQPVSVGGGGVRTGHYYCKWLASLACPPQCLTLISIRIVLFWTQSIFFPWVFLPLRSCLLFVPDLGSYEVFALLKKWSIEFWMLASGAK